VNRLEASAKAELPAVRREPRLVLRIALTAMALGIWFWTQSLIGARTATSAGIGDGIHRATSAANAYLHGHPAAANALLIVSSAIIDLLAIFLLSRWIFAGSVRPFLGLVLVLGLRQIMQSLVALPVPRTLSGTIRVSFVTGDLWCVERLFFLGAHGVDGPRRD